MPSLAFAECFSGFAPWCKATLSQSDQLDRIFFAAAQSLCAVARLSPAIE
jgi:hypothetical protein